MNKQMPRTPFSTPLSGSARETEIRLKNIFSGPKRRPPALFLVLMFSVCVFCGNLVSCQVAEPKSENNTPAQLENSRQGDVSLDESEPRSVVYQLGEQPLSEAEQTLLDVLFRAAEREGGYRFQMPTVHLLASMEKDGWLLGAVFVEDYLENTLILGIMDRETREVPRGVFQRSYHAGVPNVVVFQNDHGEDCLLYTFNGQENGQYDGEAGMVRFDGEFMTWQWPVEGDIRYGKAPPDGPPGAFSEYQEYWWNGHLAVPAPGGLDIYTVNPEFEWGKEEPWSIWELESGETFYHDPSSAAELPMPIYFQSLSWLIGHTNDPGGWRIVSLELNGEKCAPEKRVDCYTLQAREEHGTGELTADLFFPYDQAGGQKSYDSLDRSEVREDQSAPEHKDQSAPGQGQDEPASMRQRERGEALTSAQDDPDKWNDWNKDAQDAWDAEQDAAQAAEYQSVGVTVDGKNRYYQGQLVNLFLDIRPNKSFYTLDMNPEGSVNIKIVRSANNEITGVAYMTEEEATELLEDMG